MQQIVETGGDSSRKLRIGCYWLQGLLLAGSLLSFGFKRIIIGVILLQAEFMLFYCLNYLRKIGQFGSPLHRSCYYALVWNLSRVMLLFLSIFIMYNLTFTLIIVIICGISVNQDTYWDSLTNTLDGRYKAHFSIIIQFLSLLLQFVLSYLFYFENASQKAVKSTGRLELLLLKDLAVLNTHNNLCAICLEQLLSCIPSCQITQPSAISQDNKEIIETASSQLNIQKQEISCSKLSGDNHTEGQSKGEIQEESSKVSEKDYEKQDFSLSENNQKQQGLSESECLKQKCNQIVISVVSPKNKGLGNPQGQQHNQQIFTNREFAPRKDKIINLNCNHLFHFECIQRWIESSSNLKCPTCRQGIQTN